MSSLTPKQIVSELDKFVIGQVEAKKAVAVALRNRWRRKLVDKKLREEIIPHNILMVGPTGVGKTEIARRLAKLSKSPFIKVEATKFTEIGYVGKEVESIIRELLDIAIKETKKSLKLKLHPEALQKAKIKLVELIVGPQANNETKKTFFDKLQNGELDDREVEFSVTDKTKKKSFLQNFDIPGGNSAQMGIFNLSEMLGDSLGNEPKKLSKFKVPEAIKHLTEQELEILCDESSVIEEAIKITEQDGIVFIDEIDKIAGGNIQKKNEVNREGVQRDLLPLIEGTTVSTKYGSIKTDHILFIASGAFHLAKPTDLLPELQGRLPIKVELLPLTEQDLYRILSETEHALPKQYKALLETENVKLKFAKSGLTEIAKYTNIINSENENIGARRLITLFEKILEDITFAADELTGKSVEIDAKYVTKSLATLNKKNDLKKFVL
jgi:ATP-dependent HslUV protease ATP-binding subunit HslU